MNYLLEKCKTESKSQTKIFRGQMMGQILFRQAKKPLFKGFFMYSMMPPTGL